MKNFISGFAIMLLGGGMFICFYILLLIVNGWLYIPINIFTMIATVLTSIITTYKLTEYLEL